MAKAARKTRRNSAARARSQTKSTERKTRSTATRRMQARRSAGKSARKPQRRWSARVPRESDALTLESKVFTRSPDAIARSLKQSAERSRRRKSGSFRSAMSMLTSYINRAGRNLSAAKKKKLERAKESLCALYGRA